MALTTFLSPELAGNEGTFRAVDIVAPPGTLVNPRPPAPTAMSTLCVGTEIIHAIWQAMSKADPASSCAGWGKVVYPITFGKQPDGNPYVLYHWSCGVGAGAIDGRDGFNANGGLVNLGALHLPDVELSEQSYPISFRSQLFREDGGGPGNYRGGTGIDYAIEIETPSTLVVRGEGLRTPSGFGMAGGQCGAAGEMTIEIEDKDPIVPQKYCTLAMDPMTIKIKSAGGGGWGDPLTRDPELVLRDVRDGTVSRESAERVYGIVLAKNGESVDAIRTNRSRMSQRETLSANAS